MTSMKLRKIKRACASVGLAFAIGGLGLLIGKLGLTIANNNSKEHLIEDYRYVLLDSAATEEDKKLILGLSDDAIYELAQNSTDREVYAATKDIDGKRKVEAGLTIGALSALVGMNGCMVGDVVAGDKARKAEAREAYYYDLENEF